MVNDSLLAVTRDTSRRMGLRGKDVADPVLAMAAALEDTVWVSRPG
jgi:hypothetical protein